MPTIPMARFLGPAADIRCEMPLVRLADLALDMILATDLVAADGRVLARAGTALTSRHLQILHKWGAKWGIEEVSVRGLGTEDAAASPVTPEVTAAVDVHVAALFQLSNGDHPAVKELIELTRDRMLREASAGTRGAAP